MKPLTQAVVRKLVILAIVLITASAIMFGIWAIGVIDVSTDSLYNSGEVTASEGNLYLDRAGQQVFVGELENDHGETITEVVVFAEFLDDGEVIAEAEGVPFMNTIPHATTVPFEVRLPSKVEPDVINLTVTYETAPQPDYEMTLQESDITHQGQDSVAIYGIIENSGDTPVEAPKAITTFYNEEGQVIGVRSDRISPWPLEPGETGEFTVRYSTVGHVPSLARDYADHQITFVDEAND